LTSNTPPSRRARIAGIGETRYTRWGRITDASEHALAREAILRAVADAGLGVDQVDGITSFAADRLLWDHRELGGDHAVPLRSTQPVAEVVESPRWTGTHVLACVSPARGTLSAPRSHRRPLHLSSCSESMIGRAGCARRARPDPWEPRVGDCPGRPDSVYGDPMDPNEPGSGGAIRIAAGTLAGASTIHANGGNAQLGSPGGGGGGGVAVSYGDASGVELGNLSAAGRPGRTAGSPGTVVTDGP
jgi:hypothetical protein